MRLLAALIGVAVAISESLHRCWQRGDIGHCDFPFLNGDGEGMTRKSLSLAVGRTDASGLCGVCHGSWRRRGRQRLFARFPSDAAGRQLAEEQSGALERERQLFFLRQLALDGIRLFRLAE